MQLGQVSLCGSCPSSVITVGSYSFLLGAGVGSVCNTDTYLGGGGPLSYPLGICLGYWDILTRLTGQFSWYYDTVWNGNKLLLVMIPLLIEQYRDHRCYYYVPIYFLQMVFLCL